MPVSKKQLTANKRNATRSTGPKTNTGKAVSSQNAVRHGLTAASIFVPPDQAGAFSDLQEDLCRSLRPVGMLEHTIFQQILAASWNLRRIASLKSQLAKQTGVEDPADLLISDNDKHRQQFLSLERYQVRNERSLYRGLSELQRLQTTRALYDAHAQSLPSDASPHADTAKLIRYGAKRTQPVPNTTKSQRLTASPSLRDSESIPSTTFSVPK